MEESSIKNFINNIEKHVEKFENQKLIEKIDNQNLGIIYTPLEVVDYIVTNILRMYLAKFMTLKKDFKVQENLNQNILSIIKNQKTKDKFITLIRNLRILDPSCGSGRFLITVGEKLYNIYRIFDSNFSDFEIKKQIIENNLYGIEIDESALFISKLQLIKWLFSTNINYILSKNVDIKDIIITEIDQITELLNLNFNLFNLDFLLEFNSNKFDIIIGNPPYVENKKIKNIEFKRKLTKRFKSAYRLFDLSILFIEKALELLENEGYLSFIMPNKFLSADYGIKIRKLLLNQTEIEEIINVSSLSIFQNAATYPIILTLKKAVQRGEHDITIKIFNSMNKLIENSSIKTIKFDQNLINNLPSKVIPISGNIELINFLYKKFNTFAETFKDLKIIYRPFGFLKYSKHFSNVSDEAQSFNDLLLIGTGNIGKYHIKFKKRIKIAGNDIKISYFNYHNNFEQIWGYLKNEKLIFREIAKDLTCCYDPGVFTNITGLYFIIIPTLKTEQLFGLLTILNSKLIDSIFKSLFSTLHMAGGYLRYNGSFIKRLPMPKKFPSILAQLGKILQLLSQLKYDFDSYKLEFVNNAKLYRLKNKYRIDINKILSYFNTLSNSLVNVLYLEDLYIKSHVDYNILEELLNSKKELQIIPNKFLYPQFNLENYKMFQINELDDILNEINDLYNQLNTNRLLLSQVNNLVKNFF